jgi:hypothetical protein
MKWQLGTGNRQLGTGNRNPRARAKTVAGCVGTLCLRNPQLATRNQKLLLGGADMDLDAAVELAAFGRRVRRLGAGLAVADGGHP